MMRIAALLVAFAAAAHGAPPGYNCERRVNSHGSPMPHFGVCQVSSKSCDHSVFSGHKSVTPAARPFYMKGQCNDLPGNVRCCIAGPPEPGSVYPDTLPEDLPNGVTAEQLKCCMEYEGYGFPTERNQKYLADLNKGLKAFGLTKRSEVAAFLAQVGAESGSLYWWTEQVWSPKCDKYDGGCTYKGRGPIQLTHKENFQKAYNWLRRNNLVSASDRDNIVKYPHRVAEKDLGFLTTLWFWKPYMNLSRYCDDSWENFLWLSKKINGGLNGIAHRAGRWAKCTRCLGGTSPNADAYNDIDVNPGCTAIGGTCNEASDCSNGFQQSGLCRGRTTKCCIPHDENSRCGRAGGRCGTDGCPNGRQQPGLCPGEDPVCCISEGTARDEGVADDAEGRTGPSEDAAEDAREREPSECSQTGGQCVASGDSCEGYAVNDVGQKGCDQGSRCCRPACSDVFGFCRGANDCSEGEQRSLKCPGASMCCITGRTREERVRNLRIQSLAQVPDEVFTSVRARTGDQSDVLVAKAGIDGADLGQPDQNDAFGVNTGRSSNNAGFASNGLSQYQEGGLANAFGLGKQTGKITKKVNTQVYKGLGVLAHFTGKTCKFVQTKAQSAGLNKNVANWWIHQMKNVVRGVKSAAQRREVDVEGIQAIMQVAGPRPLGRYYDFWTNRVTISDDVEAAAEIVALGIDNNYLSDDKAERIASISTSRMGARTHYAEVQDSSTASLLGVRSRLASNEAKRIEADIQRLERDIKEDSE